MKKKKKKKKKKTCIKIQLIDLGTSGTSLWEITTGLTLRGFFPEYRTEVYCFKLSF